MADMINTNHVREGLRALLFAKQPKAQRDRLEALGLSPIFTKVGVAFKGTREVRTNMGFMYACELCRKIVSRHRSPLEAHIEWQLAMKECEVPQVEPSIVDKKRLLDDLELMRSRSTWVLGAARAVLEAEPNYLAEVEWHFQQMSLVLRELYKETRLRLKKERTYYSYQKSLANKKKYVYKKDLHPHLHKKIVPTEIQPDGSEAVVAQLRAEQRARQKAQLDALYGRGELPEVHLGEDYLLASEQDHDSQ